MSLIKKMEQSIDHSGGLIVSCQPVDGSPMDRPEIVAAMAQAAVNAGAMAVRIEGIDNLKATRPLIDVPIIGIVKRDLNDSPVRITPWLQDIDQLAENGADIIAFDGTDRIRPVAITEQIHRIHQNGKLAMADCANLQEGWFCWQSGAEFIGSTMSGYISGETPDAPDLNLVNELVNKGCRVIAEGRYNTPYLAQKAINHGAWAVTVGSAITRLEHVCEWFILALKQETRG